MPASSGTTPAFGLIFSNQQQGRSQFSNTRTQISVSRLGGSQHLNLQATRCGTEMVGYLVCN
jgi:hypothetical protein